LVADLQEEIHVNAWRQLYLEKNKKTGVEREL
jgi:hypothetical protein